MQEFVRPTQWAGSRVSNHVHAIPPGSTMSCECSGPRHLRYPGEEGYRTPVINGSREILTDTNNDGSLHQSTSARVRVAHSSALQALRHSPCCRSGCSDVDDKIPSHNESHWVDDHLSWKKRIRHFTWAFFTLTMATGGIANVIYNGNQYRPTDMRTH